MSDSPWFVRVASAGDRALLATFSCADPTVAWQVEVETFIQKRLLDWALAPGATDDEPRVLLVFRRGTRQLVGLAAHERLVLHAQDEGPSPATFHGTPLQVVAVAKPWQGREVKGTQTSDIVMSAAMTDISARIPPRPRILAVVHKDNVRSLALCRRYGFVIELSQSDPSYRRLMTGDGAQE